MTPPTPTIEEQLDEILEERAWNRITDDELRDGLALLITKARIDELERLPGTVYEDDGKTVDMRYISGVWYDNRIAELKATTQKPDHE